MYFRTWYYLANQGDRNGHLPPGIAQLYWKIYQQADEFVQKVEVKSTANTTNELQLIAPNPEITSELSQIQKR
jgi:hypothetical protein